jgi:diadenosine tetraphosphate (Ap4A) HIT family hydrolase
MADNCPICSDTPGHHWLWRDDRLRVIDARDADHPAFLRVIWHGHQREMTDLGEADRLHLMDVVWQVERCVREVAQPDKINLGSLGNMVPHLHWHVIARFDWDSHFPASVWANAQRPRNADKEAAVAAQLSLLDAQLAERLSAQFG